MTMNILKGIKVLNIQIVEEARVIKIWSGYV